MASTSVSLENRHTSLGRKEIQRARAFGDKHTHNQSLGAKREPGLEYDKFVKSLSQIWTCFTKARKAIILFSTEFD